jgi:hypothetical protein
MALGIPLHPGRRQWIRPRQVLAPPATVREVRPERCACGNITCAVTTPYPYASGDRVAHDCDGGDALGFASELVSSVWALDAGTCPSLNFGLSLLGAEGFKKIKTAKEKL